MPMTSDDGYPESERSVQHVRSHWRAVGSAAQAPSLVERLARLGCTRMGSPGIFGVRTR
jgi:hypothetical protein